MKHILVILVAFILFGCTKEAPSTPANNETADPYASELITSDNELAALPQGPLTDSLYLTDAEKEGLIFMREEEKLARDVYQKMEELHELRVFTNIKKSEQVHTTVIKNILNRYGVPDPVVNDIPGVFVNPDLQNLYNTLVERGMASQDEALRVGKDIELVDIEDLDHQLHSVVQNAEVFRIYTNLKRASTFHLKAFNWWLPGKRTAL